MYEVQSTKYQVPPFDILQSALDITRRGGQVASIKYQEVKKCTKYEVPSTMYLPSIFCNRRSAFDIRKV